MITLKLSKETSTLRPYISELLLYSGISDVHVEVGETQTKFGENVVFVEANKGDSLEDVLSKFALKIYNPQVHKKCLSRSEVSLSAKYGNQAHAVASVIEKAVEPVAFFGLERVRI